MVNILRKIFLCWWNGCGGTDYSKVYYDPDDFHDEPYWKCKYCDRKIY